MELTGEQRIAAPRAKVWAALNDPDVLRQCIPGCQSLDRDGADRFDAVAEVKIGPIGARFNGSVQLSEIDAPNGYVISGKGNGGIAGNAQGKARVRLADDAGGTLLNYTVNAEVGGRMAQLGGPIIDATARNLAGKFFEKFGTVVAGEPVVSASAATVAPAIESVSVQPAAAQSALAPASPIGISGPWGWIGALVLAIIAGFVLGTSGATGGILAVVLVLMVIVAAAAFEAGRRGKPQ
ncbi:MAG: carbon monoxide dehydrogenase subunit G [Novosphingobium sp.]